MTAILGGLGELLGGLLGEGSVARQFFVWGILSQVVTDATGPFMQALRDDINAKTPIVPLSPADLADMTVRGVITPDVGPKEAAKAGLSAENFALMVTNSGEPPALQEMLQLFRRGLVTSATMEHAIRQSRVRDEWIPYVLEMGKDLPTPIDILTAYLKGQVDQTTAMELYTKLGGEPTYFQLLYDTRGEGPSPNEAAMMARRGLIPWDGLGAGSTSYEQAVHEGAFRNKWAAAFKGLANYIPPPRTVSTLYSEHAITQQQALTLYQQAGLSPELAAAFLSGATKAKTAVHRNLAASTIDKLYQERAISHTDAMNLLQLLGYDQSEAQFVLLVNDMARQEKYLSAAVGATHTNYAGHKISKQTASATLDALGVEANERDALLALWTIERGARVAILTPAQVKKAALDGVITADQAMQRLTDHGYSTADANIYMQI